MATKMPISLKGPNLGERHRYLNSLVIGAYNSGEPVETILESSESSPVDRLYKIDLASKHKQLEYILKNLQDNDMLYVSRALKSTWLLEEQYCQIITPEHLEDVLYPHMITTAVNKMKHWILLNLKDPLRCQEFYMYYSKKDFDYAFKFFCKCTNECILNEFPNMVTLEKITPQRLKILCEKTSVVAKLFFEISSTSLLKKHSLKEQKYFNSIKCVMKIDIDSFLNIAEKYFLPKFNRLNKNSTKFIMTHRKNRFMQKSELYTARILNVGAVAQCLTPDECEDLVIKLARAIYLADEHWFNYKSVEPLFKRIDFTKRANLKKKVFVYKDVGESVPSWPYDVPKILNLSSDNHDDHTKGSFLEVIEYDNYDHFGETGNVEDCIPLCSAKMSRHYFSPCVPKRKTPLDALFEEYRFSNFDKTLFELRKKIKSESSSQMRMYMYLVLVSKSGGRPENMVALFDLLMKYKNEPCQVRTAVIRSLVKRVSVWRVSEVIWENLLIYGQGLGLDGNIPETECIEGLHAVVIRALLSNRICEPAIKIAFLSNFSTLDDYLLTISEKEHIKEVLLKMLLESANNEASAKNSVQILEYVIYTLEAYEISQISSEFTGIIKKLVKNDSAAVQRLLKRLFRLRLGRKEFFRENFDIIQTDASYVNALKHDITILSVDKFLESLALNNMNAEFFLRKIRLYFSNGNEDLAARYLIAIKEANLNKKFARPITYLIGEDLKSYMLDLDRKDEEHRQFSALLRANAHVARPALSLDSVDWQNAGAKLIANRFIICKTVDIDAIIKKLLTWNRTARLAVILAQRTSYEADIYEVVAKIRPIIALKAALAYFRRQKDQSDVRIWEAVKPLMVKVKDENPHLIRNIRDVDSIPVNILPEYLVKSFKLISRIDFNMSMAILFRIKINLPRVDENFIEDILKDFIENRFVLEKLPNEDFDFEFDKVAELYLGIFAKYLLLCENEDVQQRKLQNVAQLIFDRLQEFWEYKKNSHRFLRYLNIISRSMLCTDLFLSNDYVSCLPVMQNFVDWMRSIIPAEEYFVAYVSFHLNMLYYKTIRQAAVQIPGLSHDNQRRDEGYQIVGETFGKYVAKEARVLANNYFDSIVMLYRIGLVNFFDRFNKEMYRIVPYFVKGILDASDGIECTLALDLYEQVQFYLSEHEKENILNCFRQNNLLEMQFYLQNWSNTTRYL